MRLLDLPKDCILYLINSSPLWAAKRLSLVNKELRSYSLPVLWRTQSLGVDKSRWLVDNPSLIAMIRVCSIIPCEFFGTDDDPPSLELLSILSQLFASFSHLNDLTIPYPEHALILRMLSMPTNLVCLRLTLEHPTVPKILEIASLCPQLQELFFSFFDLKRPLWIMNDKALGDFAVALARFPHLSTLDLCASVRYLREDCAEPPSFIGQDELYDAPHGEDSTVLKNEYATLLLARKCSRLRRVYWSAAMPIQGSIAIWFWRIFGEEDMNARDLPGSAVCEGLGVRDNSWGLAYDLMKPNCSNFLTVNQISANPLLKYVSRRYHECY